MFIPALIALGCLGASLLLPLFLIVWVALHRSRTTTSPRSLKRSAAVVVLGDVGRSPRMCYHAESLANQGWKVGLVGYEGTVLPPPLQRPSVRLHALLEPPKWFAKLPKAAFIVVAPLKIAIQSTSLFWALAVNVHPPPELILVQTPPALPTLFIVRLVAWLLRARVIIDWHNLGYTILGLRLGSSHPLVRLAAWLERLTGRRAFAHLFVTHAMKRHLEAQWGLKGHKAVLHDRPPVHFRRANTHETHILFTTLAPRIQPPLNEFWPTYAKPLSTPFTVAASTSSEPNLRTDRPVLAVSSTSWTADEDFDILLEAARKYEFRAQRMAQGRSSITQLTPDDSHNNSASSSSSHLPSVGQGTQQQRLPKLLVIVTGKGQLRAHYERLIATAEKEERWKFVRIRTAWLEVEEYPVLLGSADIGISLHSSSSGLDLPMKVVDMLGCGLPVLALNFPCLPELISDGRNGLVFNSAGQLADQLAEVAFSGEGGEGGGGRNWMVKAMEEDEALAFGWGDEPPEAVVAAASLAASARTAGVSADRLGSLKGATSSSGGGLPTHSSTSRSGSSSPMARDSIESSRPSLSLVGSPVLGSGESAWESFGGGGKEGRKRSTRARKVATWTGNWRRVVRPLLNAAEEKTAGVGSSSAGVRFLPSDQAQAERVRRKLDRAKRKGKGLSVHHRKGMFGGQDTRDDEDYLLHNSDDDDEEDTEEEEEGGEDGSPRGAGTAVARSNADVGDGLTSRKQRSSGPPLAAISIPPNTTTISASSSSSRSELLHQQQRASLLPLSSGLSPSHPHPLLPPSVTYSPPDSPSTSPVSFPPSLNTNLHHNGANSEPLSPISPFGLHAHPFLDSRHRRLSANGQDPSYSRSSSPTPGTSSSDADKRWRRRRTYSGSSSLYNGLEDDDPSNPMGSQKKNGGGVRVEVDEVGEFVTPFEMEDGVNGSGKAGFSPTKIHQGNVGGGSGGGGRTTIPLHSPLASPAMRRTSLASVSYPQAPSAGTPGDGPHGRNGDGEGGVRILPSRQLDSHWSPQGDARRGNTNTDPRKSWSQGDGDVPDIRVSPANS
ncbi:hypothetical protein CF327_g5342 [Tilletia walkeri]|uniref:Chitobiosyldiphosphodolichol beta-mannosyltransferase n=1 Tax=Tilletia walkeri TaxID=117179 RepID=A0A8X7T4Y1_9BASI|nr:hypothetical protein CF327_g5342 [Tilletia walkeri]KAE8268619.1 hypothetical protein A4X09_0g3715 [Tilletia walkeri]